MNLVFSLVIVYVVVSREASAWVSAVWCVLRMRVCMSECGWVSEWIAIQSTYVYKCGFVEPEHLLCQ